MYGEVVDGVDGHRFEQALTILEAARGVGNDVDLDADDLRRADRARSSAIYEEETGDAFPQDPREQLRRAIARGLRVLERAAGAGLPARLRDP